VVKQEPPQETTVEKTVEVEGAAKGGRLALALLFVLIGVVAVGFGIFKASLPTAVRVALILAGLGLVGGFGYVAVGATRVGGTQRVPGANIPQGSTVRTKIIRRGFPKKGRSPLDPPDGGSGGR
jgi:hypothetical protein